MLVGIDYFCCINCTPLNPKKIVITGAPGTGKSSIIRELEFGGYRCFHEVIRDMTLEAKKEGSQKPLKSNPLAFVTDPRQFNKVLLEGRLGHFLEGSSIDEPVVFYDRGIPDVLAYMDYFEQEYGEGFRMTCRQHRYDKVILLPPWEEIYISDNERLESFEEAMEIHNYLMTTYRKYGYEPLSLAEGTVQERTDRILFELTQDKYL